MNPYQNIQRNNWLLSVNTEYWRDDWWSYIDDCLIENKSDWRDSRHAHSQFAALPGENKAIAVYLKLYKKPTGVHAIKECMRESKHRRAFRITQELGVQGFSTPTTYICGDIAHNKMYSGVLVTEKLPYIDLSLLPKLLDKLNNLQRKKLKRTLSTALGQQIGRLHNLGYVHGDLVITNILVDPNTPSTVVFIDHDRSTRSPTLIRKHFQMRNLIQINRHLIDGINQTDRLRVFLAYAKARQWNESQTTNIMREVTNKTIKRRLEIAQR